MPKNNYERVPGTEEQQVHPLTTANPLSIITIWWMKNVFKTGRERPLDRSDFLPLRKDDGTRELTAKLQNLWNSNVQKCNTRGERPKLWKAVMRMASLKSVLAMWSCFLVESGCRMLQPVLLGLLIRVLTSPEVNRSLALGLAALMALSGLSSALTHNCYLQLDFLGMRMSSAIRGLIYHKIFLVSKGRLQEITTGRLIDFISNDIQRLKLAPNNVAMIALMIIEIPVVVLFMLYLIGWQALMGMLFMLATLPYVGVLSSLCARLHLRAAQVSDQRISLMDELVSGIRTLKTGAWEGSYSDKVKQIRRNEIGLMLKRNLVWSFIGGLLFSSQHSTTFVSVAVLLLTGRALNPATAFMLLSFSNNLRYMISYRLGQIMPILLELLVSFRRIEEFLLETNMGNAAGYPNSHAHQNGGHGVLLKERNYPLIFVDDLALKHQQPVHVIKGLHDGKCDDDSQSKEDLLSVTSLTCKVNGSTYLLKNVSFEASRASLTVITGQVGSGKSTLLSSIAGEMAVTSGTIAYHGAIAYVSQTAWIFSGTIRDNILFGKRYVSKKYARVIEACALKEDIQRLPKGDLTFVGERGAVLSGGQRARVSLARAVYADADVYLLDDPLSAVDVKIGEHIFNQCICELLQSKMRLMVTHGKEHIRAADQIVVLHQGSVLGKGSFPELMESNELGTVLDEAYTSHKESIYRREKDRKAPETRGLASNDGGLTKHLDISEEDRETGTISWKLYWDYFRAGLHPVVLFALFAFFVAVEGVMVSTNFWLYHLSQLPPTKQQDPPYLGVYSGLAFGSFLLVVIRCYLYFKASLRCSTRLYGKMVDSLLKATIRFFDTNPAGRILNRLSKDIGCVDEMLPEMFLLAIQHTQFLCAAVLLPCITNPWIIFMVLFLGIIFGYYSWYYLKTSRELRRLESICRTPVYSHFSETISGLDTIRTQGMEGDFIDQFYRHQDLHNQATSMQLASARWFAVRADVLCSVFTTTVAMALVTFSENAALTGLVLAYVIETAKQSQFAVRLFSQVENNMTSVERVIAYTKLDPEPGYSIKTFPPKDWPRHGSVSFRNVVMRYYQGGPQVLKNVSFEIPGKAKVGIVGRTGDGKSSIVAALLRMPEAEGDIFIDELNITCVQLQELRCRISVLSQTPVLFSGSLRSNIDPLEKHSDGEVWGALEDVQLRPLVENLEGRLDYQLSERGANLSVGERQLVCLARTLLQQSKIVILDEPTAHVDPNTERTIWNTVRDKLQNSTVVTIAHRLNTIRACDMILVLRDGKVAECDTFETLMGREGGVLHNMATSS